MGISEWFAGLLGDMTGSLAGLLLKIAIYLLLVLVVWGFWWDRILSKAGFMGGTYWWLFLLLVGIPTVLGPIAAPGVATVDGIEVLGALCGLSIWLGIVLVALLPWPTRRKPKATSPPPSKPGL